MFLLLREEDYIHRPVKDSLFALMEAKLKPHSCLWISTCHSGGIMTQSLKVKPWNDSKQVFSPR